MFLYEGIEKYDKKVKAVLIGCGEQATNMIHNAISYLDEIEVVGVCDMNKDRADFAARRFGLSRSWQDTDEMLANVQADCAFVVTIAKLQAPIALKCVEAGLHVFTEKPLATEREDIERLIAAARKNGKKIGVSFNKRFNVAYHDMKKAIESDGFGAPSAFSATFIGGYRTNETDLLRVGSCHFFDLARFLIGEVDEVFAYCYEKQPGQHMFAVTMQFENGCVGTMMLGSLGSWVCGYGMERVEVRGDRNMVSADNGRDFMWQRPSVICESDTGLANKGTQAVTERAVPVEILRPNYSNLGKLALKDFYINGNYQSVRSFAHAILDDTDPEVGWNDGLMALNLALAVEKSVNEGRAVKISEVM